MLEKTAKKSMKGKRVGVIGGGQLAWMMGAEAPNLDLKLIVQTPHQDDPAVSRAEQVVFGKIDDPEATAKLATLCDVITFENEFLDLNALQELALQGVCFRPSLDALAHDVNFVTMTLTSLTEENTCMRDLPA